MKAWADPPSLDFRLAIVFRTAIDRCVVEKSRSTEDVAGNLTLGVVIHGSFIRAVFAKDAFPPPVAEKAYSTASADRDFSFLSGHYLVGGEVCRQLLSLQHRGR